MNKRLTKFFLVITLFAVTNVHAQSSLWSMTSTGGTSGVGNLFQFNQGSNTLTSQVSLQAPKGLAPNYTNFIQATDGNLYGMTAYGGANNAGVIFQYNTATSAYLKVYDFNPATGANPNGSLMQANDGNLYGMTYGGGANGQGVLFQFNITSLAYADIHDFNGTTDGQSATGSLIQASDGNLYGLTPYGGAYAQGTLFSYNISTSSFTELYDFNGVSEGNPIGSLLQANDGNLYGLGSADGTNFDGTIFEYNLSSHTFNDTYEFSGTDGNSPNASFIQATDGNLYTTTSGGGVNSLGNIIRYNISTNAVADIYDFDGTAGVGPSGSLIQASDGNLYGTTSGGGSLNDGVIFQYNLSSNSFADVHDFNGTDGNTSVGALFQATDGNLYGMSSNGGFNLEGNMFQYNISTSAITSLVVFDFSEGNSPYGSLMKASDGNLYGMVTFGGNTTISGIIFKYAATTNTYSPLYNFDYNTVGGFPYGSLMQANDGNLYGMTNYGGAGGAGSIFQYNISTNSFAVMHSFSGTDGGSPYGSLIQAGNGNLYGMTNSGGVNGFGTIFSYNYSSNTYTDIHDFTGADGSNPYGSLIQGSDGNLYGMTNGGGANGFGTLIRYTVSGNSFADIHDFNGTEGGNPFGSLIQATDGNLYGMTNSGGANGEGSIFQYIISSSVLNDIHDYTGADGANPYGSLMQSSDGNLYGMTNAGGANSIGVIFKYSIAGHSYTDMQDFNGINGQSPYYSSFIEVGPENSISDSTVDSVCAGGSIAVAFTATGTYNQGNEFIAQLSDANGGFGNPVSIGTITSTGSGSISATIPGGAAGNGYKIRVISSSPSIGGTEESGWSISVDAAPAPVITGTSPYCVSGTIDAGSYSSYVWGDNSTGETLNVTATGTYNVTVTDGSGCSGAASLAVTVISGAPGHPSVISGNTTPCSSGVETYSIVAQNDATSYTWTYPSGWAGTSTTNSITVTVGNANGNVTVVANNACGSSGPRHMTVTSTNFPNTPGNIHGSTLVCNGGTQTYTINSVNNATSYSWSIPSDWSGTSSTTSITVTAGSVNGNILVLAQNACGMSPSASVLALNSNVAPTEPGTISGASVVCNGDNITYSIAPVAGATSYTWTLPAGWGGTSQTVSINAHANGSSGNISVSANNTCGSSNARVFAVVSNSIPSQPGSIIGVPTVCPGSIQTYSVTPVTGATSYNWTIPNSWAGTSSTNSLTLTVGNVNGNISVSASNACGTGALQHVAVTLYPTPNQPGVISGSTNICGGAVQPYSINAVNGATGYTWTLPSGWAGTSSNTSITVTSGNSSGTISVAAYNVCGINSNVRTLNVNITPVPAQPQSINGNTTPCNGGSYNYSIPNESGATNYTWMLPNGWTGSSTDHTISTTVGTSGGTISASANNACGNSSYQILSVSVNCTIPTNLATQNIHGTSARANWNQAPCGVNYNVSISLHGLNSWTTYSTANSQFDFTGLSLSTSYDWRVQTNCSNTGIINSGYSAIQTFTTNSHRDAIEGISNSSFNIYPNPANEMVTVVFTTMEEGAYSIKLIDMLGREVKSEIYNASIGNNTFILNLDGIAKGVYIVLLQNGDNISKAKLVVE